MYTLIMNLKKKTLVNSILLFCILLGGISMFSFKNYEADSKAEILALINELEVRNIKYVFADYPPLPWQIMFYSNEKIIARYKVETDRIPEYVDLVDNALKSDNAEVAMVGFIKPRQESTVPDNVFMIEGCYYIYFSPDINMLREHGFKFKNFDG